MISGEIEVKDPLLGLRPFQVVESPLRTMKNVLLVFKILPSKHSSWWRRTKDILKTSSRRLQCNIFLSSKRSWRRLEGIIARRLANTSWRRLEDVLKRSWKCYAEDVFMTFWRRLGKEEMFAGLDFYPNSSLVM